MEVIEVFSLIAFLSGSAIISIILLRFKNPRGHLIDFSLFSFSYFVSLVFLYATRYIFLMPFLLGTRVILSYMCFRPLSPGKLTAAGQKNFSRNNIIRVPAL